MPSFRLLLSIFICGMAVVIHQVMFSNVGTPPADFGSGSMFDLIARRYDFINRVLAIGMDIGWRKRMVEYIHESVADLPEPPRLLDVATGTADVALLLADRIPTATVLGADPSPNMLQVGREKIKQRHLTSRITLEEHDARQGFAIEANSFDGATMAFGIRNIVQKEEALCQIHHVLRNQSLFCILEFSEPDDSFGALGAVARFFIRNVIPTLGGLLSGKPKEYLHLQNSIKDFPTPPEFVKLLENVNCPTGTYKVEALDQLNFGSVQLYVSRVLKKSVLTPNDSEEATGSNPATS